MIIKMYFSQNFQIKGEIFISVGQNFPLFENE